MAMVEISPWIAHTQASAKSAPKSGGMMIRGMERRFLNERKMTNNMTISAMPPVIAESLFICRALYTATMGPPITSSVTPSASAHISACSRPFTRASFAPVSPMPFAGSMKMSIVVRSAVKSLPSYISYSMSGAKFSNSWSRGVPIFRGSRITTSPTTIPEGEVSRLYTFSTDASMPSSLRFASMAAYSSSVRKMGKWS